MAISVNITYGKLYTIGKSKLCWFQMCANGVGRQSGREDMSKTKVALNPRLRLEVFHITVKCPSKVGQRKVCYLVRNCNVAICHQFQPIQTSWYIQLRFLSLRRNVTYLGLPKLGRLYRYVKSLPTFCFPHISSSTSSSTYFATSLYHTKFALSNGAKSLICYIGK